MKKKITNNEKETFNFAKSLANTLKGGEIIALSGELGAGKTIFSKGVAQGLGIKKNVTSPTFVIMKIYNVKKGRIKKLCHIDAYRLNNEKDLLAVGAEEYMGSSDTVTIIEWPEMIIKILPKNIMNVKIVNKEGDVRIINY